MRTKEMKALRTIRGKIPRDRSRNEDIQQRCGVYGIKKYVSDCRKYWNKHIERMDEQTVKGTKTANIWTLEEIEA